MEALFVYLLGALFFGLLALFVLLVLTRYTDKTETAQHFNKETKGTEPTTTTGSKTDPETVLRTEPLPTSSEIG